MACCESENTHCSAVQVALHSESCVPAQCWPGSWGRHQLWLLWTCRNLGCCHTEPVVPGPRDTVHGCPAVRSLLQAGMPVHSRKSSGISVTLRSEERANRAQQNTPTLSCMSSSSWQGAIDVRRIRAVKAWHLVATRDCLPMPNLAMRSPCWISLCSRAKWASKSTHSSCLLASPQHTHWLTLWAASAATLKHCSTETSRHRVSLCAA